MKVNQNENPVIHVEDRLSELWKADEIKEVVFPIFMKIGLIEK